MDFSVYLFNLILQSAKNIFYHDFHKNIYRN